jgi:hypothetical protein
MASTRRAGIWAAFLTLALIPPAAAIPSGTYQQSCKDIKLKDPDGDSARIQANCRDSAGKWRKTSFEIDRCWGDLANIDGELVCVADQRHGGAPGFPSERPPPPIGKPKDVAVDVCVEWAVREAYAEGAGYARLLRIEDIDRKDGRRIKVKGVILSSPERESRSSKDLPFRCDTRDGEVLDFKWR